MSVIEPGGIFLGFDGQTYRALQNVVADATTGVREVLNEAGTDRLALTPRVLGITIVPAGDMRRALQDPATRAAYRPDALTSGLAQLAAELSRDWHPVEVYPDFQDRTVGTRKNITTEPDPDATNLTPVNVTLNFDPEYLGAMRFIGNRVVQILTESGFPEDVAKKMARSDSHPGKRLPNHMGLLEYQRMKGGAVSGETRDAISAAVTDAVKRHRLTALGIGSIMLGRDPRTPTHTTNGRPAIWPIGPGTR